MIIEKNLIHWTDENIAKFGKEPIRMHHELHRSPLFQPDAIAELIERSPRRDYYVNTMDIRSHNLRSRREGEIKGISGHDVLKAVANGEIWINLVRPHLVDKRYAELAKALYADMAQHVPGLKTWGEKISILISSPKIQAYYHADVPGQMLWQISGRKKVYVYPNRPPYLQQAGLERIILNEAHEMSLHYDKSFDNDALIYDLQPGEMLHWPLNAPHRVVNEDIVNVSFTTEHYTSDVRRSFIVNYANGVLRRHFGDRKLSQTIAGPRYWAKLGYAGAYKLTGRQKKRHQMFKIDFAVDPNAPRGVRDIAGYEFQR